jgi:hypothetical protein
MTAVPKYSVSPSNIVTICTKRFSDEQRKAIARDMNQKGYLVGICPEDVETGTGAWFDSFVNDWECDDDLDGYLDSEDTLYAVKPTPAQLKKLGDKPTVVGSTGDYDVIVRGDKLVVGCQTIPKAAAVKLAQGILKAFGAQS